MPRSLASLVAVLVLVGGLGLSAAAGAGEPGFAGTLRDEARAAAAWEAGSRETGGSTPDAATDGTGSAGAEGARTPSPLSIAGEGAEGGTRSVSAEELAAIEEQLEAMRRQLDANERSSQQTFFLLFLAIILLIVNILVQRRRP